MLNHSVRLGFAMWIVTSDIHMLAHAEIVIVASCNRERKSLFQGQCSRGLPATENLVQHTIHPRSRTSCPCQPEVRTHSSKRSCEAYRLHPPTSPQPGCKRCEYFPRSWQTQKPSFGSSHVVNKFRKRVGRQQREPLRNTVRVVHVQGVVIELPAGSWFSVMSQNSGYGRSSCPC